MASGTVKKYDRVRGFGFIAPDDGGPDRFFEFLCLEASQRPDFAVGQRVEFDPIDGSESPAMKNLRRR